MREKELCSLDQDEIMAKVREIGKKIRYRITVGRGQLSGGSRKTIALRIVYWYLSQRCNGLWLTVPGPWMKKPKAGNQQP
jgi:hypothetical protein